VSGPTPRFAVPRGAIDTQTFARLAEWSPDEATWRRVLVDNPAGLYESGKGV